MGYNRIMAYNVKYNGLTFLNTPTLQEWGSLVLKEFSFFEVATQSNTTKYAVRHWEYVNPTEMKNRRVRILFDILANNEQERRALLKKVQRAFTPESNPSPFNERLWKDLSFLDVDCIQWEWKCQVLNGIQLSDFANQKRAWISVELITDSPYFYSNQEFSLETKNTLAGIKLPVKLPFYRQYHQKVVNINYEGVVESPLYIELNIVDNDDDNFPYDRIKIIHQSELWLEVMYINSVLELNMAIWDKIIVDSENRRCYFVHGDTKSDITSLIEVWSDRPSLYLWSNIISIDTGVRDNECIEATIKWKNLF